MSIIAIVIVLMIIGVLLWAIETLLPMDATIRTIIRVVVLLLVLLWILSIFTGGFGLGHIGSIHVGR